MHAQAWTRFVTDEGNSSLQGYAEQSARRRELGLGYPVHGVLDGSAESFAFPLTREQDRLSLATQCHAQLRARMLSTPLVDVQAADNTSWVTLPLLRDMLAEGVEWRPLERAAASLHAHWPRAEFVRRLLAREASDNDLELLFDKRLVPGASLFCPDATRAAPAHARAQPHHVLDFGGGRGLGDVRAHCPCGTATLSGPDAAGDCDIDARVCETVRALAGAAPDCLRVACNALADAAAPTLTYESAGGGCLRAVREFLGTHAAALRARGFTCTSMAPSDLWGLDAQELNQPRDAYSDEAYVFLKNGVSAANAEQVAAQVRTVLDEGRRTAHVRSPGDASGNTRVDNVLCAGERAEPAVAELAFPAVSMVAEAPAVTACLNYIMQHSVYAMVEFAAEQQGVRDDADVLAVLQTRSTERAAAHERCALQLARLDTCVAQGAFDDGVLREAARVRGAPRDKCPFEAAADMRVFVLDPPCVALVRAADPALGDTLFDLPACVALGALREGDVLTPEMLGSALARNCSFADPRELLARGTGEAAADLPLLSAAYVQGVIAVEPDARTGGVLGVARGVDWLFPGADAPGASGFAAIPYWPGHWQPAALGQQLVEASEAKYGGAFDGYMALLHADESDGGRHHFVVLPHHLRNATLAARVFGAAGFCREPTYALPMAHTNTLRQCTSKRAETISAAQAHDGAEYNLESGACSPSAAVSAGGGLGDTVGDLWPLLRPLLAPASGAGKLELLRLDQLSTAQQQQLAHTLAHAAYTHALALEDSASLEDVTAALCSEDYSVHANAAAGSHTEGGCYKNAECLDAEMCSSALGRCTPVEVEVDNQYAEEVEFALSSEACEGQGPRGASPWEQVAGLLHAHGLCAHANTVAYEYMQQLERAGLCQPVPGGTVHRCKASAEWHWVRQVPPQAPAGAFPETPTDLYEAEGRPWQTSRTGMFALEPHECDAEYMADSQELKMCRLERVSGTGTAPQPSPWMRTSDWYAETFYVLHDLGIPHVPGPPADEQLHEKLRFLGLRKDQYQHATAETPAVLNCRAIGLCGIETVRVAGVKQQERLLNLGQPHAFEDNKVCGAMGVQAGVGQCKLDPRTTVLYNLVRMQDAKCHIPHLRARWQRFENVNDAGFYSASPETVDRVRAELNAVLLALPNLQSSAQVLVKEQASTYNKVHECAARVQAELELRGTAQIYDAQARANASGLYFFYEYEAHELPVLWWLKYQQYALFYPEARAVLAAAGADPSGRIPVPSFDARLSMHNLLTALEGDIVEFGGEPALTLRDAWARSPLRVDLTRANVEELIAIFIGFSVQSLLLDTNRVKFKFACPYNLTFREYAKTEHRASEFESIADGYWVKNEDSETLADSIVNKVHKHPQGIVREYETGALAAILRPARNQPGNFETEETEVFAGAASVVQDMVAKDFALHDVQVLSPFDPAHRDVLLKKFNPPGTDHVVPIARFTLLDTFELSNETVLDAVQKYEARSGCSNEQLQFEVRDELLPKAVRYGTRCIYGPSTAARLRESVAMGQFVDGEPAVELVRKDNQVFTRYLCEHDADVVPDYMDPEEGPSKYPQCSFRQPDVVNQAWLKPYAQMSGKFDNQSWLKPYAQMSAKFDNQPSEIPMPPNDEVPDGFCEYDEYGSEPYLRNLAQPYSDTAESDTTRYFSAARAYMQQNAVEKPYTDRCFRLDSACVAQDDGLQEFFTGLDKDGNVYDDVYERIEHNAFTQMSTNGARYYSKPDHLDNAAEWNLFQERYDAWATSSQADFVTENKARTWLSRRPEEVFTHKRRSRVHAVRFKLPAETVQPEGIQLTEYLLNMDFSPLPSAHAYLTSKDRVLFNVPRMRRNGGRTREQLLFGHHKHHDGGRTLAAPTFSFCPGADPAADIHFYRKIDTASHRRVTAPAFGVRASTEFIQNTRQQQKLFRVVQRNAVNGLFDALGYQTWNELAKLLFRRISFSPIMPSESPASVSPAQLQCRSSGYFQRPNNHWWKDRREINFYVRADPRELNFDEGSGDHWLGKNLPCLDQIHAYYWPFDMNPEQVCFPTDELRASEVRSSDVCELARTTPTTMSWQKLFYDPGVKDSIGLGHYQLAREYWEREYNAQQPDSVNVDADFWWQNSFTGGTIDSGPYFGKTAQDVANIISQKITTARTNTFDPSLRVHPFVSGILSQYLWTGPELFGKQPPYAIERNSMLDVFNVFQSTPASDDEVASSTRPCRMPRAGQSIALEDLATCYEQDVHEAPNRRPWWSTTACDMLRGVLDGMSSYESLRYWLRFKLPEAFSLSFLAQFSAYDLEFIRGSDPHLFSYNQLFKSKYTSANLETFLTNHIVARDETVLLHHNFDDLYKIPKHQDLVRTLLGMHIKDERTEMAEDTRKLFLTPCLKTYRENSRKLHVIQSLDDDGHCKYGDGASQAFITKPTLWSEMDGRAGEHLVPCKQGDVNCQPLIVEKQVQDPNAEITSYRVQLGPDMRCRPSTPVLQAEDDNEALMHLVPVWAQSMKLTSSEQEYQGIWDKIDCRTYNPAATVLRRRRPVPATDPPRAPPCVGCGLYQFDYKTDPGQASPVRQASTELQDKVRSAYRTLVRDVAGTLAALKHALELLPMGNYLDIRLDPDAATGTHTYLLVLKLKDNATDMGEYAVDAGIRDAYDAWGQQPESSGQMCFASAADTAGSWCPFKAYNSELARGQSAAFLLDIQRACVPLNESQLDRRGMTGCLDEVAGDSSSLRRIRQQLVGAHLRNANASTGGLALGVDVVGGAANATFRPAPYADAPSWKAGVHAFFARRFRGEQHTFLRGVLSDGQCANAWGTVPQQERSCFKLKNGKVSVLTPWLGGNYSFPMAPNPNSELLGTAGGTDVERTKLNLGFDMCTVEEGDARRPALAAHEFVLPDIRACHATDCLRHARANASNYTLCSALAALPAGLTGLTWPEAEFNAADVRAKVAPILTRDSVLLTQPPRGHCGAPFPAPHGHCTHMQAPLGFAPSLTRGFVRTATSFGGNASLAGRTRRDVLRLGRAPDLGVLGTWAGHSVFGLSGDLRYRLLARDEQQTGAHRVVLRIEPYTGLLRVAHVGLAPGGAAPVHADNWVGRAHAGLARDAARIAQSALYPEAPAPLAEFGHWACPLVRAAVFGGDAGVHEAHARLRLLTPDPPRMRAVYADSELGGAHPFVNTSELHGKNGVSVRAYARFALAHMFPLEHLRAADTDTAVGILEHAHTLLRAIQRGTMQVSEVHGAGARRLADWPALPKHLRSGESHKPGAWNGTLDLGARLQDVGFAAWWLSNGTLAPPVEDTPDTLARGGDCHRAAVPVLTRAELQHLLSFDDCRRAHAETPAMLALECSRAGQNGTERVELPLHPLNVARAELQDARFARPRHAGGASAALGATRLYAARGSGTFVQSEHELSASEPVRVSPLYALRRWLHATPLNATVRAQTVQELWQTSLDARQQAWQFTPVAPRAGVGLRAVGCVVPGGAGGAYNASADDRGGAARWEACSAALASSRSAACANGTNTMRDLDLCEIDAFFDLCAHIQQWRRDVAYVNAAASGSARVHAELYVPSMFDPATSAFVQESVRDTYVTKGVECAAGASGTYEMRSAEKCYGAELIALVDELKLVHDFGMRVLFVIMDYYRMLLRLLHVFVAGVVPEVSDGFTTAVRLFWDDFGAFMESVFELFPDVFTTFWELISKSSGFGIFSSILTGLCELLGRVSDFVNTIVEAINVLPGINLHVMPLSQACALWTAAQTSSEYGYSEQLLPSRCVSQRLDMTVPVDFFGTTYGSFACHRSSFCTPDAGTFADEHAVLCGTCAGAQFACDLATKTCRCGRDLDRPATPCMRAQDCAPLDSVCEVREGLTDALGTMPCASSRAVRSCYLADARAAAGRCAVLPQHSLGLLPACEAGEVGQQASEARILGGEFCVATTLPEVGLAFEFDDTFTAPCYLLALQGSVTQCVSMREPAGRALWLVLAPAAGSSRRLLAAADGAAAGDPLLALAFASRARLLAHAGQEPGGAAASVSCLPVLAACDARDPLATAACAACARVLWFWNLTLAPGSGGDAGMLAPHRAAVRLLREPALRRTVHARAPAALSELARHWLNDTLAWRALVSLWPQRHTTRAAAPGHAAAAAGLLGQQRAAPRDTSAQADSTGASDARRRRRRRLLQAPELEPEAQRVQAAVDSWRDAAAALDQLANRTRAAGSSTPLARAPDDLSAADLDECMKTGVAIVDNIQQRFTRVFKLRGYSPRRQCPSRTAAAGALVDDAVCPLVSLPFQVVLDNFAILMRYYSYMAGSGCTSNADTSCLPPAQNAYGSVELAFPRFNHINITERRFEMQGAVPEDPFARVVLGITERLVTWLQVAFEHPARYFLGFISLDAFHLDAEWERQRSENMWSLGRLARDALTCDYEEITFCQRLRSPLHIVVGSTLLLVVVLHLVVPIHPVLSFFVWTLALTVGIPFFAYGFSPLCLPRVPNCLPEGVYNLTRALVPEKISIPRPLLREGCSGDALASSSGCLLPCDNATRISSAGSILLALEPMLRRDNTHISEYAINATAHVRVLGINASAARNLSRHFVQVFTNGTRADQEAAGFCMALHGYKVLAWYVLFVLMLPVVLVLVQYLLLAVLSLFATLLMLVNNTTDVAFMPHF